MRCSGSRETCGGAATIGLSFRATKASCQSCGKSIKFYHTLKTCIWGFLKLRFLSLLKNISNNYKYLQKNVILVQEKARCVQKFTTRACLLATNLMLSCQRRQQELFSFSQSQVNYFRYTLTQLLGLLPQKASRRNLSVVVSCFPAVVVDTQILTLCI